MPQWHADAPHGTFRNERGLTAAQKETIERWVAAGAAEGDPADLPPAPTFAAGWRIGQPDVVFEMPEEYAVPAKGTLLEVVIETRDRAHLEDVMKRLGEAGFVAWLPGRR